MSGDEASPALQAEALTRHYRVQRGLSQPPALVRALDGVSFSLPLRRTLAVLGEPGSGKSTLARVLAMVEPPTSGVLRIDGSRLSEEPLAMRRILRRRVQLLQPQPFARPKLRQTVAQWLAQPLVSHLRLTAAQRMDRVQQMLQRVGLQPALAQQVPHGLNGVQRLRLAIARALMLGPGALVADEPGAELGSAGQAQMLDLLAQLQDTTGTAYVVVSHDLKLVQCLAHEVLVMHMGAAVEQGTPDAVLGQPLHPYTQALLAATPTPERTGRRRPWPPSMRLVLAAAPPSPLALPSGCSFHPRCPWVQARCRNEVPLLRDVGGRRVACHVVAGAEQHD